MSFISQALLLVTHTYVDEVLLQKIVAHDFFAGKLQKGFSTSFDNQSLEQEWDSLLHNRQVMVNNYEKKQEFRLRVLELYENYEQPTLIFLGNLSSYSEQLQEGMLRLLEEPPHNAHLVLFVHDVSTIITTIKSRSQVLPLPSELVFKLLPPILSQKVKTKLPNPAETVKNLIAKQSISIENINKLERNELELWLWQLQIYLEKFYEQNPQPRIAQAIKRVLNAKKYNQENMLKRLVIEGLNLIS